jgi:hypothetical protein
MAGIEHPAAEVCRNANYGGFTDWFLPSKDEAILMFEQKMWMDGETLDSLHEERLYRVLTILRHLPFDEPYRNRAFILYPQGNGTIPLDLLIAGNDEAFRALVTKPPAHVFAGKPTHDDRKPLPPSILMNAMQENLHVDLPGRRSVKVERHKGKEG